MIFHSYVSLPEGMVLPYKSYKGFPLHQEFTGNLAKIIIHWAPDIVQITLVHLNGKKPLRFEDCFFVSENCENSAAMIFDLSQKLPHPQYWVPLRSSGAFATCRNSILATLFLANHRRPCPVLHWTHPNPSITILRHCLGTWKFRKYRQKPQEF